MSQSEPLAYAIVRDGKCVGVERTHTCALHWIDAEIVPLVPMAHRDELLAALVDARHALELANSTKSGPICDTIWMPSHCPETLFDFMDAAIASVKGGAA